MSTPVPGLPTVEEISAVSPGWLDEALSTPEAAQVLKLPERTLETYRYRGGGPAFIRCGRRVAYLRRDLISWLYERREAG